MLVSGILYILFAFLILHDTASAAAGEQLRATHWHRHLLTAPIRLPAPERRILADAPGSARSVHLHQNEVESALEQLIESKASDKDYVNASGAAGAHGIPISTFVRWTSSYPLTADTYVHIGWRRLGLREWNDSSPHPKANPRRPYIIGEWNDRPPGCQVLSVLDTDADGWDAKLPPPSRFLIADIVRLSVCNGPLPQPPPQLPASRFRVTVCTPIRRRERDSSSLNYEWLRGWLKWYQRLGVEHFYLYVIDVPFMAFPGVSYEWIDMSWDMAFGSKSRGQIWSINDCLHRNRAQKNEWGFFVDLDELLTLPGAPSGLQDLSASLDARGYSALSIASVPYMSTECSSDGSDAEGYPYTLPERIAFRAPTAEACFLNGTCHRIARWGRRKMLMKFSEVFAASFHHVARYHTHPGVPSNPARDDLLFLNLTRGWVKHARGAAFDAALCSGTSGCNGITDGFNCSNLPMGPYEVGMLENTRHFVRDSVALKAAAAEYLRSGGDVLSGSSFVGVGAGV